MKKKDRNRNVMLTWWRHRMETFSALLAICAGNSPVPGEFPAQKPVTRSFDVFFDLRLNKRLSKQSRGSCFETLSRPLLRHCDGTKAGRLLTRFTDFQLSMDWKHWVETNQVYFRLNYWFPMIWKQVQIVFISLIIHYNPNQLRKLLCDYHNVLLLLYLTLLVLGRYGNKLNA